MKIKMYIPYFPNGEIANDRNDLSDEAYANMLINQFGSQYNNFMNRAMAADGRYDVQEVIPEQWGIKSVDDKQRIEYYQFECILNNEEDSNMGADEFSYYANSNEMAAFFVHMLVGKDQDPDSISEINFWLKDSRGIMADPNIDDEHKVGMLPDKDIIIEFDGNDGLMQGLNRPMKYILSGSRVIDQDNVNNFAIIVNKIQKI